MPTSVYDPDTDRKNPGAQHETDMLERMYHAPSATNSGSKQLARRELANKESAGNPKAKGGWKSSFDAEKSGIDKSDKQAESGWQPSGRPTKSDDTVGKGYTGEGKKQSWFQRHKKGAAGWLTGLILLGGGGSAVIGPIAGPFEFIHFASIVKDANFGDAENGGDSRAEQLARYAFYKGKPQNVRLSVAGNYVADKIEARMNASGFQSAYTEKFGYLDGYFVDKAKLKGTQFKDATKMSDAKLKDYFKANYDVNVTTRDGKLFIDGTKLGYRGNLRFLTSLQRSAGVGKTFSALQARIMGYRGGVTWHPIEKLQQKTGRAFETAFKQREKARIQNGNNGNEVTTQNQGGDDETKNKNATDLQGATDEVIAEGKNATTPEGVENLKSSVGAKLAGGGLLAVGTLCILHSIAANVDNIEQTQVIMPLIRISVEVIALGQQVMFGKVDVDPNQLAEYKKYLHDPKTGKDWNDSPAIKAAVGEDVNGKDPTAPRIGQENIMAKLFGNVPGLDAVCGVINSAPGQVVSITLGLLGGPISAVATVAFTALGPTVLDAISRYIAGEPIDTEAQGATRGTYAMYGGRLAANDQMIAAGGQELSASQEAVLNNMNENVNKAEFQSHSLAYRIFNPYDYRSLMGSFLDKQKPDAMANVASLAHGILNFGSTIVSMPQSILTGQSSAKSTYDYGFLKYGYTAEEFDNAATKNPYENGCYVVGCPDKNITGLLQGDKKDNYIERAGKCFGINLGADGTVSTMEKPPTYKDIRDNDCKDAGEDWLRIRFYIYDTQVVEGMACYFGDATACTNVKMGGGSAYNTLAPKWNLSTGAAA